MRTHHICLVCAVALAVCAGPVAADYQEPWETGSNDWYYFVEGAPNNNAVPMAWVASGGQSGAFVKCPLGQLTQWSEMPGPTNYWPCWTLDANHPIDLVQDPMVRVYLKDIPSPLGPVQGVDLGGGGVYFWVGEWHDAPDPDPNELNFFYFNTPLSFGDDWTLNVLTITSSFSDWTVLQNDQGKTPADLLVNPQQWGFGIFGGSSAPTGVLGFDTFWNLPEPASLTLLAATSVALLRRRRRRR